MYFKASGKYYSEGEYISEKLERYEIYNEVKEKFASGCRPGLFDGPNEFYVLIQADGLEPSLVMPD